MTSSPPSSPCGGIEALQKRLASVVEWTQSSKDGGLLSLPKHERETAIRLQISPLLEELPPQPLGDARERSFQLYLRGKAIELLPTFSDDAEQCLSRAVKLNPTLSEAWYTLGNVLWKKGDLVGAENCFRTSISINDYHCAKREASRILRLRAGDPSCESPASLIKESVVLAKEAVSLDLEDPVSWCALGNAYLSSYTISSSMQDDTLNRALKAYQRALSDPRMQQDPDLRYNLGVVLSFLQKYDDAYRLFCESSSLDTAFEEPRSEMHRIFSLSDRILRAIRLQGLPKSRRMRERLSRFSKDIESDSLTNLGELVLGQNKGRCLVCCVVESLSEDNCVPRIFAIADLEGRRGILSVYHASPGALASSDVIVVEDPILKDLLLPCLVDENDIAPSVSSHCSTSLSSVSSNTLVLSEESCDMTSSTLTTSDVTSSISTCRISSVVPPSLGCIMVNGRRLGERDVSLPHVTVQSFS